MFQNPKYDVVKITLAFFVLAGATYFVFNNQNSFRNTALVVENAATSSAVSVKKQQLYLAGGLVTSGFTELENKNDVWTSGDGVNWSLVTEHAPWEARSGFGFVYFKNKLWVLGGFTNNVNLNLDTDDDVSYNDVWASNDGGLTWNEVLSEAPWDKRFYHTATVYKNRIWVIGGRPLGPMGYPYFYNDVWYTENGIDWVEATEAAPFHVRYKHSALVYKNKLWIIGGAMESNVHLNDVWYSSDGISWTEAIDEAAWEKRGGHDTVIFNGKMLVLGGERYLPITDQFSDMWYSENGVSWGEMTSPDWSKRFGHQVVDFNTNLWVYGGTSDTSDTFETEDQVWKMSAGTWSEIIPTGNPFEKGRMYFGLTGY